MPSTPVTRSVIRSSSVPPRLPTLPTRNGLSAVTRRHVIRTDSHVLPPKVAHQRGVTVYGKVLPGVHVPHVTVGFTSTKFYTNNLFTVDLLLSTSDGIILHILPTYSSSLCTPKCSFAPFCMSVCLFSLFLVSNCILVDCLVCICLCHRSALLRC